MERERYAKLTIVCGRKGSGKTNYTLKMLYKAVQNGRKVLIFDAMDEFREYIYRPGEPAHSIKPIFIKDIPRFTVQSMAEIVRIRPYHDNGLRMTNDDKQKALYTILKTYRNGILLVEDINVYIGDNPPNDIIGSLATLRQAGVDLIMHYQLVQKAAHPKLMGMASYIRFHKTNDEVARFADRFLDKTDICCIAEIIVNRRYFMGMEKKIATDAGQYFNVVIDLEYHKIRGIFTKREAESAIEEYMSKNSSHTIGLQMQRKTKNGSKFWSSYQQAYEFLEKKMLKDFFVFDK